MVNILKKPLVNISIGLAMLTVAVLLFTDFLGLVPDTNGTELKARKAIAESLAIQLSSEINDENIQRIENIVRSVVTRNSEVISAAIRKNGEGIVSEYGNHNKYWTLMPGDRSTAGNVQVPLFADNERWGTVELAFTPLGGKHVLLPLQNGFVSVVLFTAIAGFAAYLLFLKIAMRELNPDDVIPERVRTALDTLSEGLMIVDRNGYIVFANKNFAHRAALPAAELIGKNSLQLNWLRSANEGVVGQLPWIEAMDGTDLGKRVTLRLRAGANKTYTFNVNTSTIKAPSGRVRGALVTFDDMTEIESKNKDLRRALMKLERSQREITRKNQELQVLATRDPLTNSLNRRSLFQGLGALFAEAIDERGDLSCIMVDIDHFKSVNDRFGHAVGDKVIKYLAHVLTEYSRPNDLVGRLGGEEFCIVLPGADETLGVQVAERMRCAVQQGDDVNLLSPIRITASFGVSTLNRGTENYNELLEQADQALYQAKDNGRNRVACWSGDLLEDPQNLPPNPKIDVELRSRHLEANAKSAKNKQKEGSVSNPSSDEREVFQSGNVVELHPDTNEMHTESALTAQRAEKCSPAHLLVFDRIDQAINRANRYKTHVAVLLIEMTALQRVNDTLGFAAGDNFSRSVVRRLKDMLRSTDTVSLTESKELLFSVSLLGSREIVIILTDLPDSEAVTPILQRIVSANNHPIEIEGTEIYLNMNIGASLFPTDGEDSEALVKHASSAMHEAAKQSGRNNFLFFSDEINRAAKRRIHLEAELHRALQREELVVHYQPKIDLKTGDILGVEALIRWQHAQLGLISPNDFIHIAEQNGLIMDIGYWVIHTVCNQILHWAQVGYGMVNVAINLSAAQFRHAKLGDEIIEIVKEYDIPRETLELEITETVIMQNMETAIAILEQLHQEGFGISVDDFGTGYSSLSYLKRFPLSKVKIDRSFISDVTETTSDAALVSAIIAMGHSLGLRVVAEGVETEEQLRFLQDLNCDEIQGFLISKPIPEDEASDLLACSSSIKRLISDYGIKSVGISPQQHVGATSGMIGVVRDFTEEAAGFRKAFPRDKVEIGISCTSPKKDHKSSISGRSSDKLKIVSR